MMSWMSSTSMRFFFFPSMKERIASISSPEARSFASVSAFAFPMAMAIFARS